MAGNGFIRSKMDIKFVILYLMARINAPVDFPTAQEMSMVDDGFGYFDFSECMAELVQTGHLSLTPSGMYAITEKGVRDSRACESNIPLTVRENCDASVELWNRKLKRRSQVRADILPREDGAYTVRLVLNDDNGNLMDLKLMAVQKDMAKQIARTFETAPEEFYQKIMETALTEPKAE